MTRYRVDLPRLLDLVERMDRFDAHVTETCDAADEQVRRLHAEWSGAAAAEQLEVHRRWSSGAMQMTEALGRLRAAAEGARLNYVEALDANARMWRL